MTSLDAARQFPSLFGGQPADQVAPAAPDVSIVDTSPVVVPATSSPKAARRVAPARSGAPVVTARVEPAIAKTVTAPVDPSVKESPSVTQAPSVTDTPAVEDTDDAGVSFASLGIPAPLVRTLREGDITTPFPIQAATIPDALAGRDVLGRGQTGSGKTLAFGLPLLTRIKASGRAAPRRPKALILVPTRELAMQVNDVLTPLAKSLGLFTKTAFGGAPYHTQIGALDRGVDVLVATPGRLGDLIERGACSLGSIEITVLDEADQMADLGFLPDVTALLAQTPANGQRLMFSATLDNDVAVLVKRFLTNPVTHELQAASASVDTMDHHALLIPPTDKFGVLASIANRRGRTIMFVKTQLAVDRLVDQLAEVGVRAAALHGGKTQSVRTRTLAEFREGRMDVLIATNVAARGIHVDGVSLVVHVDPPQDAKDYLHRAGRTARAGEAGTVVTLVLPRQRKSTFSMLERAGVTAARTQVTAEGAELAAVTGARVPSGVPVAPLPVAARRASHSPSDRHSRFESRGPRPARTPAWGRDQPSPTREGGRPSPSRESGRSSGHNRTREGGGFSRRARP